MWYDKEEDRYVILDDETVLDKEQHTLTCQTTFFQVDGSRQKRLVDGDAG